MDQYTKIISTLCYIKKDGKWLMLHRNKKDSHHNKRSYRGLGGKVEQGESPLDCVRREVEEEAGIIVNPIWKGVVTFSKPESKDWEAHVFTAEDYEGELQDCPEGELHWVPESELLDLDMPEGDKKLIPLLFEDTKFHAHLRYEEKELVECKIDVI